MALDHHGLRMCVLEAGRHPRFAVGESSTPAADMVLRSLASEHGMPWLEPFSRYGSWQATHPEVGCGLKRGFSYFFHEPDVPLRESPDHERSLMVAASTSDRNADTQWYRADFDAHLVDRLKETGVQYQDRSRVTACRGGPGGVWRVRVEPRDPAGYREIEARYVIDATGSPHFAETMFGASTSVQGFATRSAAVYSHFDGVEYWRDHLEAQGCPTEDHPFHPDHSALHQIIQEGWVWMLRFRDGRLSAGVVFDGHTRDLEELPDFFRVIRRYPSIHSLFREARLSLAPGRILKTPRLQRRLFPGCGEGWLSLGHAAGFVDPLHSTGIAHSLVGVERIAEIVARDGLQGLERTAPELASIFLGELGLIDRLVAASYDSRSHPELFHASAMLYFVCSIAWERARLGGRKPTHFLCAGDEDLRRMVEKTADEVRAWRQEGRDPGRARALVETVRQRIAPWNPVGLLDPEKRRMYRHTAVTLPG